jgi:hypothetical protein
MSSPVGYPDYQNYPTWNGPNLLAPHNATYPVGVTPSAIFPIAQWACIHLRMLPSSGQAKVTINWWLDMAGTTGVGSEILRLPNGTGVNMVFAAQAPFCQITVNNTGAGNFVVAQSLLGTNVSAGRNVNLVVNAGLIQNAVSIPASGSLKVVTSWLHSGWAWFYFNPRDNSGKLSFFVNQIDEAGFTLSNLIGSLAPTAQIDQTFLVPPDPIQLSIVNNDAGAAHSFDATISLITGT